MLRKSFDSVHTKFYGMRAKCRQISLIHIIAMLDDIQFSCLGIQPFWKMSTSNKVNFVNPWSKCLDTSKPISQIVPVPVSFGTDCYGVPFFLGVSQASFSPFRVAVVYPGNDKIYLVLHQLTNTNSHEGMFYGHKDTNNILIIVFLPLYLSISMRILYPSRINLKVYVQVSFT